MSKNIFEKATVFVLLCSGILEIYAVGDYSLQFVLMVALILLFFIIKSKSTIPRPLFCYFLYFYFASLLNIRASSGIFDTFILIPFLSYLLYYNIRDVDNFYTIYKTLAYIFIAFFFIQELSYLATGVRISGIIKSLPLAITQDSNWLSEHDSSYRSTSFFSEPAHFAQFLLPLLVYELFGVKSSKRNILLITAIAIVLVLLQSGNAILASIPVALAYVLKIWSSRSVLQRIKLIIVVSLFLCVSSIYVATTTGQELLSRSETLTLEYTGYVTSAYMRIFRGWDLFSLMSIKQMIFGLGNRETLSAFIQGSEISNRFINDADIYLNGAQSILIYTGFIGAIIFGWFFYSTWKKTNFTGKTILSVLLVFMFMASNFLGSSMAVCLVLANILTDFDSYDTRRI